MMLLNYMYKNFTEESVFANQIGTTVSVLHKMIEGQVFPDASYELQVDAHSVSFVKSFQDLVTYKFHLNGHADWFESLNGFGIETQEQANGLFMQRYEQSKVTFLSSPLGVELIAVAPDVIEQFDSSHAEMTWKHFLQGVYGVCTRDGLPESIFLKQAGVMFIEKITENDPQILGVEKTELLSRVVSFLDSVESDFAPHEVADTSRQRCIVNVREKYLTDTVA